MISALVAAEVIAVVEPKHVLVLVSAAVLYGPARPPAITAPNTPPDPGNCVVSYRPTLIAVEAESASLDSLTLSICALDDRVKKPYWDTLVSPVTATTTARLLNERPAP